MSGQKFEFVTSVGSKIWVYNMRWHRGVRHIELTKTPILSCMFSCLDTLVTISCFVLCRSAKKLCTIWRRRLFQFWRRHKRAAKAPLRREWCEKQSVPILRWKKKHNRHIFGLLLLGDISKRRVYRIANIERKRKKREESVNWRNFDYYLNRAATFFGSQQLLVLSHLPFWVVLCICQNMKNTFVNILIFRPKYKICLKLKVVT